MSYTGNVIKAPVSIHDVQQALGNSSGDLATLCTATAIKQWAKFRPLEPQTAQYVQQLTSTMRSRVNYGISNIPIWYSNRTVVHVAYGWLAWYSTGNYLPNDYSAVPATGWWDKQLPSTAYRLTDFVDDSDGTPTEKGYFTGAEPPIGTIDSIGIESSTSKVTVIYKMSTAGVTAGLAITYSDLSVMVNRGFKNMYFGIMIVVGTSSDNEIFLATQDNTVGEIDGTTGTLWSMGAHARFLIGTASSKLYTAAMNSQSFKIFPVITTKKNYVENSVITPISRTETGQTYIALMPAETVTVTAIAVQALIDIFAAWKNTSTSTRLIYYSYSLSCTDVSVAHYFIVYMELRDSGGNVINTLTQNVTISAGGTATASASIDAGSSFSGATSLYMRVYVNTQLDHSTITRESTATTPVTSTPSPYA